ncbi:MAG: TatD family hydrolase [Pseudohongiellaceae bacterium]
MKLVDIGANLTHESFALDFDTVVDEARRANVSHIMLTGTDLVSSRAAETIAKATPTLHSSTAGFHPHVASTCTAEAFDEISQLCSQPHVVAIGETGLDFNRNFSSKEEQLQIFEQHLELASQIKKPLFLHQREAHEEFLPLLSRYRSSTVGGVVHCFTDNEQALSDYLTLDMHIGITGWVCDERRGLDLQRLVPKIPLDRLLIETDAPYLLPRNIRPRPKHRRNEPKYLTAVLEKIAELYQLPVKEIAERTTHNAKKLFNLSF